jgi:DnaD/phage-associated family protein
VSTTENLFKVYEGEIGQLTPSISEALKDAEKVYPAGWVEDAIKESVKSGVRKWKYAEAILERWHKEGRGNGQKTKRTGNSRRDSRPDGLSKNTGKTLIPGKSIQPGALFYDDGTPV